VKFSECLNPADGTENGLNSDLISISIKTMDEESLF